MSRAAGARDQFPDVEPALPTSSLNGQRPSLKPTGRDGLRPRTATHPRFERVILAQLGETSNERDLGSLGLGEF